MLSVSNMGHVSPMGLPEVFSQEAYWKSSYLKGRISVLSLDTMTQKFLDGAQELRS